MPRFTIIIPTRNRQHTFKSTLQTVLADPSPELEILVQNNASNWDVESWVRGVGDPRLVYSETAAPRSMGDNWSEALDKARGEFVFVLGDDDGWLPGSIETIDRLLRERPDLEAISWLRYDYGWPDAPPGMRDRLRVHLGRKIQVVPSALRLRSAFQFEYSHELLPKIYSGFLRRSLLDRFRQTYGRYFLDEQIPDISTGVQALCLCREVIFSGVAFSVIGTSGSSNGLAWASAASASVDPTIRTPVEHATLAAAGRPERFFPPALAILNTYLLVAEAHGLASEVNLTAGIAVCANEMLRFPALRTQETMAFVDRLAGAAGIALTWPDVPVIDAGAGPVGLTFEGERPHMVWIDTKRIGIHDIYPACLLAKMLSVQG